MSSCRNLLHESCTESRSMRRDDFHVCVPVPSACLPCDALPVVWPVRRDRFDRVCIWTVRSYDISLFHRSASVALATRCATRGPRCGRCVAEQKTSLTAWRCFAYADHAHVNTHIVCIHARRLCASLRNRAARTVLATIGMASDLPFDVGEPHRKIGGFMNEPMWSSAVIAVLCTAVCPLSE